MFLDPPYRHNVVNEALNLLVKHDWLANNAFVVSELEKDYQFKWPPKLTFCTERLFGQTLVAFAKYNVEAE